MALGLFDSHLFIDAIGISDQLNTPLAMTGIHGRCRVVLVGSYYSLAMFLPRAVIGALTSQPFSVSQDLQYDTSSPTKGHPRCSLLYV